MDTSIKAIIGLGNPGQRFKNTRHNIGFKVLDALAAKHGGSWKEHENMEVAQITINNKPVILIKPQTFMNDSGKVIPWLAKKGINADQILVVHDELEQPFGTLKVKKGGSARGHNGLRSIIEYIGSEFYRLAFGISRPEKKEDVAKYVLEIFNESPEALETFISESIDLILDLFA